MSEKATLDIVPDVQNNGHSTYVSQIGQQARKETRFYWERGGTGGVKKNLSQA